MNHLNAIQAVQAWCQPVWPCMQGVRIFQLPCLLHRHARQMVHGLRGLCVGILVKMLNVRASVPLTPYTTALHPCKPKPSQALNPKSILNPQPLNPTSQRRKAVFRHCSRLRCHILSPKPSQVMILGALLGRMGSLLLRLRSPYSKILVLSTTFGNCGALPYVLIPPLLGFVVQMDFGCAVAEFHDASRGLLQSVDEGRGSCQGLSPTGSE